MLVHPAGQLEGLQRHRRPERVHLACARRRGGEGVDDLALRVEPDDLRDIRIGLHQVGGAQAEDLPLFGLCAEIVGQLLQLLFVVAEVEAQVLLEPEDVLDQPGAFLIELVLVQHPEQRDDGGQQQQHAQLGQGEKPAQAPGAVGAEGRSHGPMLNQRPGDGPAIVENHNTDIHNGRRTCLW